MTSIKLYLDMDGTLARFYDHADCLERMYEPGFFQHLDAYKNLLEALRMLSNEQFSLSAVNPSAWDFVVPEKNVWLDKECPYITEDHRIFCKVGENKVDYARKTTDKFDGLCILLDDYNVNLEQWRQAGGTAIKFVNQLNDKGEKGSLWTGYRIRYDWSPDRIKDELMTMFKEIAEQAA